MKYGSIAGIGFKQRKSGVSQFSKTLRFLLSGLLAIFLSMGPVWAQDMASAKVFIHALFVPEGQDAASDSLARVRHVATPGLAALSEAVDGHELDFDPICLCQESDNLKLVGVSIQPDGPQRAKARVALLSDRMYARQIQLMSVNGGWKIDNIAAGDNNLRDILGDKITSQMP